MVDGWKILCYSCAVAVYLNTLRGDFVYDDRRAVVENEDTDSGASSAGNVWWNDFWGTPLASDNSHGSYRPLSVLTFRLNHWMVQDYRPFVFHATNILLHTLTAGVILELARKIQPVKAANVSSLLFSVHPIHTEAVSSVVGRADVIACLFTLYTLLSYLNYRSREAPVAKELFFTVVLAACAALSKETGFAALPMCLLYELTFIFTDGNRSNHKKKTRWKTVEIIAGCTLVLIFFRIKLSGGRVPEFSTADNPTAKSSSFLTRVLTFWYLPVFNFLLLIYPKTLSYDWSMDSIPRVQTVFDGRIILTVLFYAILTYAVYAGLEGAKNRRHPCGTRTECDNDCCYGYVLAMILLMVPFVPATNLFFYVGFVVAERVLYIPSVGYCLLFGFGWHKLSKRLGRTLSNILFASTIIAFCLRTVIRNEDWKNEERLYKSGIHINPPKSYGNLGCILSNEGRTDEAEKAFRAALDHRFNMADVHYNLGLLLEKTGRQEEAINSYQLAIKFRTNLAVAYLKLGELLWAMNRSEEAEAILTECIKLTSNGVKDPRTQNRAKIEAFINLSQMYSKNGSYNKALAIYEQAASSVSQFNHQPQLFYNVIAETLVKMKYFEEAENLFEAILSINSCSMKLNDNKNSELKNQFNSKSKHFKIARLNPMPENVGLYLLYAQVLYDKKKFMKSADIYKTAALLLPDDYQLIIQTAYVCRIAKLWKDAEFFYKKAVSLQPQDSYAHSNLAIVLHIQGKFKDSEKAYKEALKLQPNDFRTISNYQKLKNRTYRFKYV